MTLLHEGVTYHITVVGNYPDFHLYFLQMAIGTYQSILPSEASFMSGLLEDLVYVSMLW